MAFKLTPPFKKNSPIYERELEPGTMGKGNKNGTILIRGDLDYDDDNVYWKGKVYPRSKMHEGAKNLPWEAEAYRKS